MSIGLRADPGFLADSITNVGHGADPGFLADSITNVGHGADPGFLAVRPQVTLVINPVVGCRYFPSDPWLLSQSKRSPSWPVPHYTVW